MSEYAMGIKNINIYIGRGTGLLAAVFELFNLQLQLPTKCTVLLSGNNSGSLMLNISDGTRHYTTDLRIPFNWFW